MKTRLLLWTFLVLFSAGDASARMVILSSVDGGPWLSDTAIYPLKGQRVMLKATDMPDGNVRWYRIFPDISKFYKNAAYPWEENAYQWTGFDKIDYHREELSSFQGQREICPFENQTSGTDRSPYYHNDVGSFWFQAEVENKSRSESSPGIGQSDERGLSPKVFRISIRDGQGYLGYLTSFFNIPGLFGSLPYQSGNYIGADCADVLMAAYNRYKGQITAKDYNVAMLVGKFPKIEEFEIIEGIPDKSVRWGNIRPGDFIAVRYQSGRQYQHIGALVADSDSDGILGPGDLILHAGPFPLCYSYLKEGSFDGHVRILRPDMK
jgi:hypothetical protein